MGRGRDYSHYNIDKVEPVFTRAWESLKKDLECEGMMKATVSHYWHTYWRMFGDFRLKAHGDIRGFGGLGVAFFREYRNYYGCDMGRQKGLRAELIMMKSVMRRLYMLGYCSEDLARQVGDMRKPPPRKKDYPDIPRKALRKVLRRIKRRRPDYHRMIMFMVRTGRRVSEVSLLKKTDVEFYRARVVRVNVRPEITKMREASPLMRLDDELAGIVKAAYTEGTGEWLFCNKRGTRCWPSKVREYLRRASVRVLGEEMGRKITPHYFRHRFCTECGKAGVAMVDVKAIAGIRDTKVLTHYYCHATREGQDRVLAVTGV